MKIPEEVRPFVLLHVLTLGISMWALDMAVSINRYVYTTQENTTIQSSVGTHHNIKCIDGVNYLTKVGTVKIDKVTLLPETCE